MKRNSLIQKWKKTSNWEKRYAEMSILIFRNCMIRVLVKYLATKTNVSFLPLATLAATTSQLSLLCYS